MLKSHCCCLCNFVGIIISTIIAIVTAIIVSPIAYTWTRYLIMVTWVLIALVWLGALIASFMTCYKRSDLICKHLCKNALLMLIGTIGALIVTGVFSLVLTSIIATVLLYKIFVPFIVFFVGLTLTSVICMIIGIIKEHCHHYRSDCDEL